MIIVLNAAKDLSGEGTGDMEPLLTGARNPNLQGTSSGVAPRLWLLVDFVQVRLAARCCNRQIELCIGRSRVSQAFRDGTC